LNDATPSLLLRAIATLPFSIIVTTNFDQSLEMELLRAGKQPVISIYNPTGQEPLEDLEPHRPLLVKIHGDLAKPSPVAVTEQDFIRFTLRFGYRVSQNVPEVVLYRLAKWTTFLIGWSFRSYNQRFLWEALQTRPRSASEGI
jgi:hypothetical protein